MIRLIWFGGWVSVLLLCSVAQALDPRKAPSQYMNDVWQVEQGLPQNSVQAIAQTPDGYMWLGTQLGIVRFDGAKFTVFSKENTPGISNNAVWALHVARDGVLWIGTYGGGIVRYYEGRFSSYGSREGLTNELVRVIFEDSKGNLWVGTRGGGLNLFKNGRFTAITMREGLSNDIIRAIHEDREGSLWVGTDDGLNRIRDGKITVYTEKDGLTSSVIWVIHEDREHRLWFGTQEGGINIYQDGKFTAYNERDGLPGNSINCLLEDAQGTMWIGTYGEGISRFHQGRFANYDEQDGLSDDVVWSLFTDRDGSLWIGTESGGLNRLKDGKFITYTSRDGLSSDVIYTIMEDSHGSLWMGTSGGGLNRMQDGKFTSLGTGDGLSSLNVFALLEDREGNLWAGTRSAGLNRYRDGKFVTFSRKDGMTNDTVYALSEGRDGSIWIGTFGGGVNRYKDGKFTAYTMNEGLSSDSVFSLLEDRSGNLWVGTYGGGLIRIVDGNITVYGPKEGLSNNTVFALYEDQDGVLWIGTYGGGLNRFKDGKFHTFTMRDGLSNNVITQIVEDNKGNFWISCNSGIFRVRKKDLDDYIAGRISHIPSTRFGKDDGMKSSECYGGAQPAGWKGRDGRIWFPTNLGVVAVNPDQVRMNVKPPKVLIEQVLVDGKPIPGMDIRTVASSSGSGLNPGREKFEFHYTAFSYLAPHKIQFKYRLDGFDHEWISAGTRRIAYYTSIPPGEYTFRVQASNEDGFWNESGASFTFVLKSPYYQTYWFYGLCAVAFALFSFAIYRLRVSRLKARERELLQIVEERTRNLVQEKEKANLQARELLTLERIIQVINREVDLDRLFRSLLEQALVLFEQAERGVILILDHKEHVFRFAAVSGYDFQDLKDVTFSEEEIIRRYTVGTERWDDGIYAVRSPERLEGHEKLQKLPHARCLLAVSVETGGNMEGFLVLNNFRDPAAFQPSDLGKVKRFREHAVTAVARVRMLEELQEKHQEARDATEAAEEASRAKSRFLATMSHELRTPLNAIIGYSEMLQEEAEDLDQSEFVPDLKKIKIAGKHLLSLINGILDLSKIEAGKMELNVETFPLTELLEDVLATIKPLADKNRNGFEILVDSSAAGSILRSDMIRVRQILFNVLSNACKFTRDGRVEVLVSRFMEDERDWIAFRVSDTGIGMSAEQMSRLFQAFTQADASTSRQYGGTGLGLVLSRRFTQLMGGDISMKSEPGKGSTFVVKLPVEVSAIRDAFELNKELLQEDV